MRRLNLSFGGMVLDDIVCINLKTRKTRKNHMKREARKKGFPLRFIEAVENAENPERGRFESHMKCIQQAKRAKCKNVLIMEDDCKILTKKLTIPHPPVRWDILYFGGNMQSVLRDEDTNNSNDWKRACCLMSHAYVVNQSVYAHILEAGNKILRDTDPKTALRLDEWYCREIHPKLGVYMMTPERIIQLDGFSDVKGREITYRQQLTGGCDVAGDVAPDCLPRPDYEEIVDDTGSKYVKVKIPPLESDDMLPSVTLITCVRNQADLFQMTQWSYYNIDYPRDKITWMIVDDSADEHKVVQLIDGKDMSIKYISCSMGDASSFLSVAKKINIAMSYVTANTKFVMNYSPDCYYDKNSVKARARLMMAYPQHQCFGATRYGVHDAASGKSWEQHSLDGRGNQTILFSPSLSWTREFWLERPFDETQYTLETFYFIRGRWSQSLDVPYGLITTALTWNGALFNETSRYGIKGKAVTSTVTGTASTANKNTGEKGQGILSDENNASVRQSATVNFLDQWDLETRNMIMMLGRILTEKDEY